MLVAMVRSHSLLGQGLTLMLHVDVCHCQLWLHDFDLPPHGTTHCVSGGTRDHSRNEISYNRRIRTPTRLMFHEDLCHYLSPQFGGTQAMAAVDALLEHGGHLRVYARLHRYRLDAVQAGTSELGPDD